VQDALYRSATADPTRRFHALFDKVSRSDVLDRAWRTCAATAAQPASTTSRWRRLRGRGYPAAWRAGRGVDGQALSAVAGPAGVHPKPGSAQQRPLSVPSVCDRIVQAALGLVPVVEADMLDCSFGFRPRRAAHDGL
jgi:RNA-directed DNA polymerase